MVLLAHECAGRVASILTAADARVEVASGAHGNDLGADVQDGVPVVTSGACWRSYSTVELTVDPVAGEVLEHAVAPTPIARPTGEEPQVAPDPALRARVDGCQEQLDEALGETVAHTTSGIAQGSGVQANGVTDAWLWASPDAEIYGSDGYLFSEQDTDPDDTARNDRDPSSTAAGPTRPTSTPRWSR